MDHISILLPVFNAESFLEACLDSVLHQSYPYWELIAVNDFSEDNSLQILNEYAEQDDRIRVIPNSEKGIIPALQAAYTVSSFDLITRMDADDVMPKNKLEVLLNTLKDDMHADIACGKVKYFADEQLGNGYLRYEKWLNNLVDGGLFYEEIYKECVIPSCGWLGRKEAIERAGGIVNDIYPEDYELVFRWYKHDLEIKGVDQIVHLWRDHESRTSRNSKHYADNTFLELKIRHFLELDYNSNVPLTLWGSGLKGKRAAKMLNRQNIPFRWISNNENKVGQTIYGQIIEHESVIDEMPSGQVLILVASKTDQQSIAKKLKNARTNNFWFC